MEDLASECKKKMAIFRLQELKDVLSQLGLPKTGKKQDLTERILTLLSDAEASGSHGHGSRKKKDIHKEDVAKTIDDVYRKMANAPVAGGQTVSDSSSISPKMEIVDQKVRCPCGSPLKTEFMIQCADSQCNVLQHIPCVIIPVESTEEASPAPSQHYCEICRVNRCDPFWTTLANPLNPVKLLASTITDDVSTPVQVLETSFQITRADVHLLEKAGIDVQAWCMLLNDSVQFRMQWPCYPDLKVNGIPVKTINRPGSKKLGANGRDDGPSISVFLVEGFNKISLSGTDDRTFCLGVRLVKQRTVPQVINMIPGEEEGESFTEAVARVCRCIGGGMTAANDDSDSDLEVIADNVTINLRCPMSGCRMKTAARFKGCVHLGCFDLHTLVQINQRSRKWQCPICLKNHSLEDIIVDPYLNRIVKMMQPCDEDVTEIEVKSDGSWRVKIGRPFMDLERWHISDGSLCASEAKPGSSIAVSGEKSEHRSANGNENGVSEYMIDGAQEIISMSHSSSDNMQQDESHEIQSVNHDVMMDSVPYNHNPTSGITNRSSSSSLGEQNIIVLSDSDEENFDMVSETPGPPDPPTASFSSHTANPETLDMHIEDVVFPAASEVPNEEAESSHKNNNKRLGGPGGPSGPFTFPRQPRSVRRHHGTKIAPGNEKVTNG
ncbi:putative chromatin regulator PHD family [Helianthus annuus]|uniref:Chromatin regulator PHD family n=1 Tax=Helianthus annuus TaxID=4232 RepID=A0A251U4R3_HELAN|nr:E3 SUMO-protein ligase SIZ1 isoform X1 [Helianthus annuus]KAF5794690.1 putative chromatin regulator PHD family [Helianthus annuus]KAJ0546135.1 putative chromatin regulator PHD family [Helianthus annuus]KAJ0718609.1 putative chromatin regulator PHD family [Helianthus annuus]KAJ0900979.1 putative chromatin regulator PHD family [Helianthus annuus]